MAIRHAKVACTLSYQERKALQEETGVEVGYARVSIDSRTDELKLSMDNGNDEQLGLFYVETDETSHVGRVVAIEVDRSVRIMSDVWADLTFAVVYEPSREYTGVASTHYNWQTKQDEHAGACGYFRRIQIGNSEFAGPSSELTRAKVDADPETLEVYEAWKAGRAYAKALREADNRERRIQEERREIQRDRWVRVTRGRKVKQGTEGIVFWIGESQWGTKVGIALPQEDGTFRKEKRTGRYGKVFDSYADVAWTYAKNCQVISGPGGRIL